VLLFVTTLNLAGQNNTKIPVVTVKTDLGEFDIFLYDETPKHKANFLKLVKEGFYNGTKFHRVIPNFMIQGGDPNSKDSDPNNDGQGGPGYTIEAEFVPKLTHNYGAVAAARLGDMVNPQKASSGSQFYIVNNKQEGAHFLDNQYTVFGMVIKGMEVVDKITQQPGIPGTDKPQNPISMTMTVKELSPGEFQKNYPNIK
jgi:cyclophilin family peptidyl-prolyl cis-trans isomerase